MRWVNSKGFTLIELLVVISVMSLLMAIMIPALAAAGSQARETVCRSNARQLVLANIGYATENRGNFVAAAKDLLSSSGLHRWHGVRNNLNEAFDPRRGPLVQYLGDGQVKKCPQHVEFVQTGGWPAAFEKGCGGYGYNLAYLGSRLWEAGYSYANPDSYAKTARFTEVARPWDTLMFADTAFYQQKKYLEYSFAEPRFWVSNGSVDESSDPLPSIHFRHRGRANIGWVDGHADARSMADYCTDNDFYSDFANAQLGWFDPVGNTFFDLK